MLAMLSILISNILCGCFEDSFSHESCSDDSMEFCDKSKTIQANNVGNFQFYYKAQKDLGYALVAPESIGFHVQRFTDCDKLYVGYCWTGLNGHNGTRVNEETLHGRVSVVFNLSKCTPCDGAIINLYTPETAEVVHIAGLTTVFFKVVNCNTRIAITREDCVQMSITQLEPKGYNVNVFLPDLPVLESKIQGTLPNNDPINITIARKEITKICDFGIVRGLIDTIERILGSSTIRPKIGQLILLSKQVCADVARKKFGRFICDDPALLARMMGECYEGNYYVGSRRCETNNTHKFTSNFECFNDTYDVSKISCYLRENRYETDICGDSHARGGSSSSKHGHSHKNREECDYYAQEITCNQFKDEYCEMDEKYVCGYETPCSKGSSYAGISDILYKGVVSEYDGKCFGYGPGGDYTHGKYTSQPVSPCETTDNFMCQTRPKPCPEYIQKPIYPCVDVCDSNPQYKPIYPCVNVCDSNPQSKPIYPCVEVCDRYPQNRPGTCYEYPNSRVTPCDTRPIIPCEYEKQIEGQSENTFDSIITKLFKANLLCKLAFAKEGYCSETGLMSNKMFDTLSTKCTDECAIRGAADNLYIASCYPSLKNDRSFEALQSFCQKFSAKDLFNFGDLLSCIKSEETKNHLLAGKIDIMKLLGTRVADRTFVERPYMEKPCVERPVLAEFIKTEQPLLEIPILEEIEEEETTESTDDSSEDSSSADVVKRRQPEEEGTSLGTKVIYGGVAATLILSIAAGVFYFL